MAWVLGHLFTYMQMQGQQKSSARMYGTITMQAVQKTMMDLKGNRSSWVTGVSRKRTQMERKATVKKWVTRTRGCLRRPASIKTGWSTGPIWK